MGGGVPEEIPVAMAPRACSCTCKAYNSPLVAIIFHSITSAILVQLSFTQLVVYDVLFSNITYLFEVAA